MSSSMEIESTKDEECFIPDLFEILELKESDTEKINALKIFCKKAKGFVSKKHSQDVVQEFLNYPSSCFKLTNGLNLSNESPEKLAWIFNTLNIILLRINDNLSQYENVVQDCVHHLVQYELRSFCKLLEKGQQHQGTKAALQLLTSIVMMSSHHAKALASQFIVFTEHLCRLANMRKFEDSSDIRTCVVHFVMSFLIMDISSVIRQICDHQGILNVIIIGLPCDKASLIQPFLMTIKSKVLENPSVSKTQKIRILSERSLMSIFDLLSWKGPKTLGNPKLLRKITESKEAWILQDASENEINTVQVAAFEFLKVACTSRKLGIVLSEDQTQQGKNPNFIIFKVLLAQQQLFDDWKKRELVSQILYACPSQTQFFLLNIKSSFEPRNSTAWFHAMTFLIRVASLQKLDNFLSESSAQSDIFPIVKKMQTSLGMSVLKKNYIFIALRSTDMFLMLMMTEWLNTVLGKIWSLFILKDEYSDWNIRSICNELLRFLPTLSEILPIFLEDGKFEKTFTKCELPEGVKITMVDYLNKIIDALVLCCELGSSNLESELPGTFPKLLKFINLYETELDEKSSNIMHLKVLKLISPDPSTIHLWREQVDEEEFNPLFMLFDLYIRITDPEASSNTMQLILKLFSSFEEFEGYEWEIEIWLHELRDLPKKKRRKALKLFCNTVQLFLCNQNQYIDNILECRLEALGKGFSEYSDNNCLSNDEFLDSLEKQLALGSALEHRTSRPFFTPLVPAALTAFSDHKRFSVCRNYMEAVLLKILHQQHEPEAFCILLQRSSDGLSQFLLNYICFWHPGQAVLNLNLQMVQQFWSKYVNELMVSTQMESGHMYLLSAFLLFQLEPRPAIEELFSQVSLVISKAMPCSGTEAHQLLSQSLLYLQTQLKLVSSDENASHSVSLFCTYIDSLVTCIYRSLHNNLDKLKMLEKILSHPLFKKWFITPGDLELTMLETETVEQCSHLLTDLTSKYLCLALKLECDIVKLVETFGFFKSKLLTVIGIICSESLNIHPVWVNANQGIIGCLGLFTGSDVSQILNTLLSVPLAKLKMVKDVFSLVQLLVEKFVEFENKADTRYLKTGTVKTMFDLVHVISENDSKGGGNWTQCLLSFVEQNPMYCVVASSDCLEYLLEDCGPVSLALVKILCKYNTSHCQTMHKWLHKNLSSAILWPPLLCLQIIEVVYNFCRPKLDDEQFLERLSKIYYQHLTIILTNWESLGDTEIELDSLSVLGILLQIDQVEKSSLALVIDQVMETSLSCKVVPNMRTLLIMNQVFECFSTSCSTYKVRGLSPRSSLIRLHLHWVMLLLNKADTSDLLLLDFISEAFSVIQSTKKTEILATIMDLKSWHHFVTTLLRKALRCNITGPVLIYILKDFCQVVYSDPWSNTTPSLTEFLQLILGHSAFGTIMLEDESSLNMLKEPVIDLWTSLVSLDSSCCQSEHFLVLLSSYRATLSQADQKLFYLMSLYEENGVSMDGFRPFIWGPSAMSYFSSQAKSRLSLWKQPKLEDVLHLLDKEKLHKTCLNSPLDLQLKPAQTLVSRESIDVGDLDDKEDLSSLYDARFLLLVLNHLVQLGSVVDCEKFISSQCLAFVFTTLSYNDEDLRSLGYQVLSLFYQHLESTHNHYNKTWVFILNALRNALKMPNVRLSSLITIFLGKASSVLSKPNDHLYTIIYKFLALKPAMDTGNVPEFYELFYSSDIYHSHHRTFLFSLLQEGLRTSLDFHLTQKRFVFPIILSYCTSSLCRPQIKMMILEILHSALRIRSVALVLCRTQSLMTWIQSFLSNHISEKNRKEILSCIVQVLQTLWHTSKTPKISKSKSKPQLTAGTKVDDNVGDSQGEEEEEEEEKKEEEEDSAGSDIEMSAPVETVAADSNESTGTTSAETRRSIHPFYSSFPHEFLLVCLSLLDAIRDHQEITTLCQCLKMCSQCFNSLPNSRPFLIYLTEDHLGFLLRCASTTIKTEPSEEANRISTHTRLRTCQQHAIEIIMLVPPKLYMKSQHFSSVFQSLTMFLETAVTDFDFVKAFCVWLLACLENCSENEQLLQLLLQQGNDDSSKCMTLLMASATECVSDVASSSSSASAVECLQCLLRLFFVLLGKKHSDIENLCSEISKSLDAHLDTLTIDKKIIKVTRVCQKIWLEDRVCKKLSRKLLSFSTL